MLLSEGLLEATWHVLDQKISLDFFFYMFALSWNHGLKIKRVRIRVLKSKLLRYLYGIDFLQFLKLFELLVGQVKFTLRLFDKLV